MLFQNLVDIHLVAESTAYHHHAHIVVINVANLCGSGHWLPDSGTRDSMIPVVSSFQFPCLTLRLTPPLLPPM